MSDLGFGNMNTTLNSNNGGDEEKQKTKRLLIIIVAVMFILGIVAVVLLVLISKGEKPKLAMNIDGGYVSSTEVYYEYDNQTEAWYFSVKGLADKLGYTYNRGGIGQSDESDSNCTIINPNGFEKVVLESNKKEIVKYYISKERTVPSQHFNIEHLIKYDTNSKKILADETAIERAFNCDISYDETTLKLSIKTLEGTLIRAYSEDEPTAANNTKDYASDEIRFQNNKALLRNVLVVRDFNTGLYGLKRYENGAYTDVLSTKYRNFQFIEGINKFIVQAEDGRWGIISDRGEVDVDLVYTYLFCIDIKQGLYVAGTNTGKQCVVSGASFQSTKKSKIIVPADYENIGVKGNNFNDDMLDSEYILCNALIPVQKNGKWGFYSLDGTRVVDPIYDGVGCPTAQGPVTGGRANIRGCVIIPDINAIVVQENREIPDERGNMRMINFYGLINYKGEMKLPSDKITAIFSSTENNERTYFCGNDEQQVDVIRFWREHNLGEINYSEKENQTVNSVTNNVNTVDQQNTIDQQNTVEQNTVNSTNDTNTAQPQSIMNQAVPVIQN